MLFGTQDSKLQGDAPPAPESAPADAVISPDTHRDNRIPQNQSRTKKWPVLDAGGPPDIDLSDLSWWRLSLAGLVEEPVEFTWEEFRKLPRTRIFADMYCTVNGEVTLSIGYRHTTF